jgi:hypothetical protein
VKEKEQKILNSKYAAFSQFSNIYRIVCLLIDKLYSSKNSIRFDSISRSIKELHSIENIIYNIYDLRVNIVEYLRGEPQRERQRKKKNQERREEERERGRGRERVR